MPEKSQEELSAEPKVEKIKKIPLPPEVGKPVSEARLEIPDGEVAVPKDIEISQATPREPLAELMDQTKLAVAQAEISKAGEASEAPDPFAVEENLEAYFKSRNKNG